MNLKLLFIITNTENSLNKVVDKYKLPFNTVIYGYGTASTSMLDYFGLNQIEKVILLSIIPSNMECKIVNGIKKMLKINEIGQGIAFTVPLSSSSKYVYESFDNKVEDKVMDETKKYHLLLTIVQDGYSEKVMSTAKKNGANGGTLIEGRAVGGGNTFKLFNMTIEPEKDIVLIVCNDSNKDKVMASILNETGIKTDGKGITISLPIDTIVGFDE